MKIIPNLKGMTNINRLLLQIYRTSFANDTTVLISFHMFKYIFVHKCKISIYDKRVQIEKKIDKFIQHTFLLHDRQCDNDYINIKLDSGND